jgi:DNA-binding HxlR family transcriptional regulator
MNEKKSVLEMSDLMEREFYELQKSLQNSFIRQKTLIERIDELNTKVAILGGDPNQLELKF